MNYLNTHFNKEYIHLLSNDTEITHHFYVTPYEPHVPNHCQFYKNRADVYLNFYKGDYHRISPEFLRDEMKLCKKGIIILYTNLLKFYDEQELKPYLEHITLTYIKSIGKFKIFSFEVE